MPHRPGGAQRIPRPDAHEIVTAEPPAAHPLRVDVEAVADRLSDHPIGAPLLPAFPNARPSAVLIALADGPDGAEVLLTRRSWQLRTHQGEISFPGGRLDPGETPVDAALREAHEEVALDPSHAEVLGELTHLNTVVSRSYIVPIVVRVPDRFELHPASMEVERVLWLPLAELVRPDTFHAERWGMAPLDRVLYFFHLDDETIWGATGAMLVDLLRRLA